MVLCQIAVYCGALCFTIKICFNIWVWFVCRCAWSGLRGLPALQQESVCLCIVCVYHTRAQCCQDLPTRQRYKPICPSLHCFFICSLSDFTSTLYGLFPDSYHWSIFTGAWFHLSCVPLSPMAVGSLMARLVF